ncbi:hypothetical protein RCL1_000333 [Eukaryota sp. TZLM3-RCL]
MSSLSTCKRIKEIACNTQTKTVLFQDANGTYFWAKILHNALSDITPEVLKVFKNLDSPFLLPIHDVFSEDSDVIFISKFLNDGSLYDYLQTHKATTTDLWIITAQILRGLEYLHERGIVHGNVKPENVLICSSKRPLRVQLCDFGVSSYLIRHFEKSPTNPMLFMAPEVLTGHRPDATSDLWSLGVLIYFLVHGEYPFNSADEILSCEIPISNSEFGPIISKLLVRDPASRATAADLLLDPKIIDMYENFIKVPTFEDVYELKKEVANLIRVVKQQSLIIDQLSSFVPFISKLKEAEEERIRIEGSHASALALICKQPSQVYSMYHDTTQFIRETKGSNLELSENDRSIKKTTHSSSESFVAISYPINGTVTLTLKSSRKDGCSSSFIGYFDPDKCQQNISYQNFVGVQLSEDEINFWTSGCCQSGVTSTFSPSKSIVISFTDKEFTYSIPHSGVSGTVDFVYGWVFGMVVCFEGESWSIE